MTDNERVRRAAVSVAALAQNGLAFASDAYDIARYRQLLATSAELFSVLADRPAGDLRLELERDSGYATPKVDVRGALFDDAGRVLLMRERSDGMYALPGGWADPHDTPSEAVIREVREETGYGVEVVKLIACYDRETQGHVPALPVAVYKLFFLCRATGQIQQADRLRHWRPWISAGSPSRPSRRCRKVAYLRFSFGPPCATNCSRLCQQSSTDAGLADTTCSERRSEGRADIDPWRTPPTRGLRS